MIEHFSKLLELVPLPNYKNERDPYAFMDGVLNKFNSPTKVLTNRSTKLQKDFQDLCEKALIDH